MMHLSQTKSLSLSSLPLLWRQNCRRCCDLGSFDIQRAGLFIPVSRIINTRHDVGIRLNRSSSTSTSTNNELVISTLDKKAGVGILTMNRPPANSLSLEMNEAISASIKNIEYYHPEIQSVILSSSTPTIFSAGLDISELLTPKSISHGDNAFDSDRLPNFWNSLQQVYIDLYGSRLATVAAIQGHAPAAGCMLALACDYRIMNAGDSEDSSVKKGFIEKKRNVPTIGFNETQLGIAAPPWMGQLLVRTIGFRPAERALALGTLFPPDQALQTGLVDEVVKTASSDPSSRTNPDERIADTNVEALSKLLPLSLRNRAPSTLMQRAYEQALIYASVPPQARVTSKLMTRAKHLEDIEMTRRKDRDQFCNFISQDDVQKSIRGYLEALKKNNRKS